MRFELNFFVGKTFSLDAVDYDIEGVAWACRFRLDGTVFEVMEDEEDGYRSSLNYIESLPPGTPMKNVFPAIAVRGQQSAQDDQDTVQFLDPYTVAVVLEVGTDYSDDYYPSFVCSFNPKAMSVNARVVDIDRLPSMRRARAIVRKH